MRSKRFAFTCGLLAASMLAGTVSCLAGSTSESTSVSASESEACESEAAEVVPAAANEFAAKLTAALYNENENLVFSPYSIFTALSMLSHCASDAGADTAKGALLDVLGLSDYNLSEAEIAGAHANIMSVLTTGLTLSEAADADTSDYEDDSASKFSIANALLVDERCDKSESFPELEKYISAYNAEISFAELSTEETMKDINSWVDENTGGMIPEFLSSPLDESTVAALLNAVYFSGHWSMPFNSTQTDEAVFHGADGDTTVQMMHTVDTMPYLKTDDFDIVSLYYADGYRMMLYVPHDGAEVDWADADMLSELFLLDPDTFDTYQMTLAMPKFEQEYSAELNDALTALGLEAIFEGGFDRICKDELAVSDVIHKVKISVDENGTEAAAATMIAIAETAMVVENYAELTIDRPFAYAIINNRENLVVFAGITQQLHATSSEIILSRGQSLT